MIFYEWRFQVESVGDVSPIPLSSKPNGCFRMTLGKYLQCGSLPPPLQRRILAHPIVLLIKGYRSAGISNSFCLTSPPPLLPVHGAAETKRLYWQPVTFVKSTFPFLSASHRSLKTLCCLFIWFFLPSARTLLAERSAETLEGIFSGTWNRKVWVRRFLSICADRKMSSRGTETRGYKQAPGSSCFKKIRKKSDNMNQNVLSFLIIL